MVADNPVVKAGIAKASNALAKAGQVLAQQARGAVARANVAARSFATEPGKAVFYSGPDQWKVAGRFAEWTGKQTIAQTSGGAWLQEFERRTGALPQHVWDAASKKFAKGVSGEVTAILQGATKAKTFFRVELNELMTNPNVTRINAAGTPLDFSLH